MFGLIGLILIIRLLPRALGIDLAREAKELEAEEKSKEERPAFFPADIVVRALRVESPELLGRALGDIYESNRGHFTVQKIRRQGEIIEADLDTQLEAGDIVSVVGVLDAELEAAIDSQPEKIGEEVRDRQLMVYTPESAKIVVTKGQLVGRTLGEIRPAERHACFVSEVRRVGAQLAGPQQTMRLERGDVLSVTGPTAGLERLAEDLGHLERDVEETDLLTFSIEPTLVCCGIVVTCVPVFAGYLFGRSVLKMNPLQLLGAITGAMTSGGALSVINEQSKSNIAGIAYTGAYAFANIILTIAGTLIMLL
jgi:putative transport protein